uniref:Uncharacterized protein n=1 Tax=Panagrolaimus sp. ES5 TaxID=591445 RepID=A0AC34F696_9BILA
MACLNSDILFEIGKNLVETGDQEAVYRFGLSGKEPWNALLKVFASVKVVVLTKEYYSIGWDENRLGNFYFNDSVPHSKALMNCIGVCVKSLHLFERLPIYQQILENINAKQQLHTIYVDRLLPSNFFVLNLLKHHSKTLKNVSIPAECMNNKLQNLLILDSLIFLDYFGTQYCLHNCCKTTTLTLYSQKWKLPGPELIKNPNFSSVKNLIINFADYGNILKMPLFPSVERVCYKWNTAGQLSDLKVQKALEQIEASGNVADKSHPAYYRFPNIIPPGDSDSVEYELILFK